mgnify:CR=1 FL=1
MKKIASILMAFVMCAMVSSCGSTGNLAASDTAAKTAGISCAQALTALNSNYKANGTISLSNTADLSNMLIVATSYSQLRQNKGNSSYKQSFTNGMISGSNLITAVNATSIVNTLLNCTGLNNVNASNIQQKAETVGTIITLLNALK